MSTLLILAKSQTPQGYLLEENKANKRMQERSANITREKPPQRERERERALGFLIFHGASESQSACQVAFGTSSACAQQLQFLSRTLFSLSSRKNSQFLMRCPSPWKCCCWWGWWIFFPPSTTGISDEAWQLLPTHYCVSLLAMALSGVGDAEESLFFCGSCVFCFFLAGGVWGVDAKRRRVGGFGDGFRVWCVVGSCGFLACIRCGVLPFALFRFLFYCRHHSPPIY